MYVDLISQKAELEKVHREQYHWTDIATASGIHRNTIYKILRRKSADTDILAQIAEGFRSLGLDISVHDLIIEVPNGNAKDV